MSSLILDGVVIDDTAGNDVLSGSSLPETFHINGLTSGTDTISGFGTNDLLVVDEKLFDGNNDGIVNWGANGVLDLDGPDAGIDTVTFTDSTVTGVRYLGTDGVGHYAYADASVRLAGFTEGTLGNNTFTGTSKADVFFFDTALDVNWGHDTINKFGLTDSLVTTSKIFDGNDDGKISFINGKLDLNGAGEMGHDGNMNQLGTFGDVTITDWAGKAVTALYFDHETTVNGVHYYYYDLTA